MRKINKKHNYCISQDDLKNADKKLIGNKAYSLLELKKIGCNVPDFFIVTTNAFNLYDKENNISSNNKDTYKSLIINENVKSEIKIFFDLLVNQKKKDFLFAVRSSSVGEDSKLFSFAGLYDTILNVKNIENLYNAVESVWQSFWNTEAVEYRKKIKPLVMADSMGVIVQKMIHCSWGGVFFSKNPLKSSEIMIEYVEGHPEKLVNGEASSDLLAINRKSLDFSIKNNSIPKYLIFDLINFGIKIEKYFSCPVDIEWCIDKKNQLWILQARPISSKIFTNSERENEILVHKEPFSILGCDIAIRSHYEWINAMMKLHHRTYPISIVERQGFIIDKAPHPRNSSNLFYKTWEKFWRVTTFLKRFSIRNEYYENLERYDKYFKKLVLILNEQKDVNTLLDGFNKSISMYLNLQKNSYGIGTVSVISAKLLDLFCSYFSNDDNYFSSQILLSGSKNTTNRGIVAQNQFFKKNIDKNILDYVKKYDEGAFHKTKNLFLDEYLYVWADKYPRDPSWEVNYQAVKNSLYHWKEHQSDSDDGIDIDSSLSMKEKNKIVSYLDTFILKRLYKVAFSYLYNNAKIFYPEKENKNHNVYRTIMLIRRYAKSLGLYAEKMHLLKNKEDIFLLKKKEINKLILNELKNTEVNELILERKTNIVDPKLYNENKINSKRYKNNMRGYIMYGKPISPGHATGKICMIYDFNDLSKIESGDIVICENPRPAWSAAFARSGGVIVLSGSLLSHGSILLREIGIPSVLNPDGRREFFTHGNEISINGDDGTIYL